MEVCIDLTMFITGYGTIFGCFITPMIGEKTTLHELFSLCIEAAINLEFASH